MELNLIVIQIVDKIQKKFLFFKFHIKKKSYIKLSYNLNENRFYYIDNDKTLPTKRDFSRSIEIIKAIYTRYKMFDKDESFTVIEDNIEDFIKKSIEGMSSESIKTLLFGTSDYDLNLLDFNCKEIGVYNTFEHYFDNNDKIAWSKKKPNSFM